MSQSPTKTLTPKTKDGVSSAPIGKALDIKVDIPHSDLLSNLPINSQNLIFGLNFRHTLAKKSGFINVIRGKEQEMDIDISCVLFDTQCEVIDTIWFKKLRNADSAIRHHGDSLNGRDRGDTAELDKNIDMEQIELNLPKLDPTVAHICLLVSSYYGQPLAQLERGNITLSDDEGNDILELDLTHLENDCKAMWVAQLTRELGEWRLTLHKLSLQDYKMTEMTRQLSNELARSRSLV